MEIGYDDEILALAEAEGESPNRCWATSTWPTCPAQR